MVYLVLLLVFLYSCTGEKTAPTAAEQTIIEEKQVAIQQLMEKYNVPDSIAQELLKMKTEGVGVDTVEVNIDELEGKVAIWSKENFQQIIKPLQDEIIRLEAESQKLKAAIEAEADFERKAALNKEYWDEFYPKLNAATNALREKVLNKH